MIADGNHDRLMSDINVTPFVDVMLVLLIIFMVAAPMMIEGVDVSLPKAVSKPLATENEQLIVTIDKDRKLFINNFEVEIDFLKDKLLSILGGAVDREVYLRADEQIPYGVVVRVMSEIKSAGVEKLGMVTEPLAKDLGGEKKSKKS
jgi:biopolymer transport protein TolR